MSSILYVIIHKNTGRQIGRPYSDLSRIRRRADRLDNEYGAYVHLVRRLSDVQEQRGARS